MTCSSVYMSCHLTEHSTSNFHKAAVPCFGQVVVWHRPDNQSLQRHICTLAEFVVIIHCLVKCLTSALKRCALSCCQIHWPISSICHGNCASACQDPGHVYTCKVSFLSRLSLNYLCWLSRRQSYCVTGSLCLHRFSGHKRLWYCNYRDIIPDCW